ncbi:hypothetical protein [Bifidobacterium favimelis]|uniref:Beta-carotene 15,15'-monooxygenase n=1 Tax=Bifidobacterium favimelis TaxID=3122979 RepID=A0ABU8ZL61_9BIFI
MMRWLIMGLSVILIVMMASAFSARSRDSELYTEVDGQHLWRFIQDWVGNAQKWVKVARVVLLITMLLSLVFLTAILVLTLVLVFRNHSNVWTGLLNVMFVLLAAFECVMLGTQRDKARNDYSLWIYAWFLMATSVLSAAASSIYFEGESGYCPRAALIPGGLILLTAVITSINLLLYIHDLWRGASVESLRWFKRTAIFEVITVAFVFAVLWQPFLEGYADFHMSLEVFFTIAVWEYLKHLWDERIMPAQR